MNNDQHTHTWRALHAVQDGFVQHAKAGTFEVRRRDSRRVVELNEEFLRSLEERAAEPPGAGR